MVHLDGYKQRRPTILIVDDKQSICETLGVVLEDESYHVVTAQNGKEGIQTISTRPIDLVFLDILMPGGIDGMETLRQIKRLSPETEVIIITGSADGPECMKVAEKLGAYDLLPKPLSLDVILANVEQVNQKLAVKCSM